MNTIKYTNEEYKLIEKNVIGSGTMATVFFDTQRNKAIKVYDNFSYPSENDSLSIMKLEPMFLDLKIHHAIVPEEKVYIEPYGLCGYSKELVKGVDLKTLATDEEISKITINSFLSAYRNLLDDIGAISKRGIHMCNLTNLNIVYDRENNHFNFIDIDSWDILPDSDALEYNLKHLQEKTQTPKILAKILRNTK